MFDSYRKRKQLLQLQYGTFYTELLQILCQADPIGLIAKGAPEDEYSPEVSTILPRLSKAYSARDVQQIIHEEFVYWFEDDTAGPFTHYAEVAEKIWGAWRESSHFCGS